MPRGLLAIHEHTRAVTSSAEPDCDVYRRADGSLLVLGHTVSRRYGVTHRVHPWPLYYLDKRCMCVARIDDEGTSAPDR